jgi:hypothetical protein
MKMQTGSRTTRIVIIGLLVVTLIIAGGLLILRARSNEAAQPNQPVSLASFTEHGVTVEIVLKKNQGEQPVLEGVFTPTGEDFHLYSKNLPRGGIQGLGRPTLLEVTSTDTIQAAGPLTVDKGEAGEYYEPLNLTLPVYPAGPVTLQLPVEIISTEAEIAAELSVTYMTCKAGVCLPPVDDKRVAVVIPAN